MRKKVKKIVKFRFMAKIGSTDSVLKIFDRLLLENLFKRFNTRSLVLGHSFWFIRKATENEKDAFYQNREANLARIKPGDATKAPRADKIPNFSPIPRASMLSQHRMKMDSPLSDVQSPLFMQSMRLTASDDNSRVFT